MIRTTIRQLSGAALAAAVGVLAAGPGCGGAQQVKAPPTWSRASVPFGQGQIRLGVRFRWVATADERGALVQTPDGGRAVVRVFACGEPMSAIKKTVQRRLRHRLIGSRIDTVKGVVFWRWRQGKTVSEEDTTITAIRQHGPLLIAVSSSTLPPEDVVGIALRVRLELPIPTIPACYPICSPDGSDCKLQTADDEG